MRWIVLLALATPARAERAGLTVGIGAGTAWTRWTYGTMAPETEAGLCPPAVQLGVFVRPELAIVGRVTCSGITTGNDSGDTFRVWFYGLLVHAQYYVHPQVFVGPSAGVSVQLAFGGPEDRADRGWAIGGRAGWSFARAGAGDLQLSIELVRAAYPSSYLEHALSLGIQLGWQSE